MGILEILGGLEVMISDHMPVCRTHNNNQNRTEQNRTEQKQRPDLLPLQHHDKTCELLPRQA
jgi:hypothetical protein